MCFDSDLGWDVGNVELEVGLYGVRWCCWDGGIRIGWVGILWMVWILLCEVKCDFLGGDWWGYCVWDFGIFGVCCFN